MEEGPALVVVGTTLLLVVTEEGPALVLEVMDETLDVLVDVGLVELVVEETGVLVAHAEYETCTAEATSTLYHPAPLSCCCIWELGFNLSSTGSRD
jgi:hypothetical protein